MPINQLIHETSPYLLQHAHQPVNWYPWGEDAFAKARQEDRPVFLSIGYSTCHWCHVMARESFDDTEIAQLLNEHFVSIKVDREERPDLDNVYLSICQAMTGSGGWPTSIFLTPEKRPFFAGTYFPKDSSRGVLGFRQLLATIAQSWASDRLSLLAPTAELLQELSRHSEGKGSIQPELLDLAFRQFCRYFDPDYGGFGQAPKFPTPHNLLFLLQYFRRSGDGRALHMAELTLQQMYRGGLFDHIGFGFSRYSTDRAFQIPHFEKMLYDNALLILAYVDAYDATRAPLYLDVAKKAADYVLREMSHPQGGFYSAQDADSGEVEGKYYGLRPSEVRRLLGAQRGEGFNRCYGITEEGNFHGQSIPHLVGNLEEARAYEDCLPALRAYRKQRNPLPLDDKILSAWNGLMIAALAQLARVTGLQRYLHAALQAACFLEANLESEGRLFVSIRGGRLGSPGFLDDYACVIFALLTLQQLTQDPHHLNHALRLCRRALSDFWDDTHGGFYFSGAEHESLILRPKETYDGAMPSGNSIMSYNLVKFSQIMPEGDWELLARRQLEFLTASASRTPMSHTFFLLALSDYLEPPDHITVVLAQRDTLPHILQTLPLHALLCVKTAPTEEYPLLSGQTTYYICTDRACLPPTNRPNFFQSE